MAFEWQIILIYSFFIEDGLIDFVWTKDSISIFKEKPHIDRVCTSFL